MLSKMQRYPPRVPKAVRDQALLIACVLAAMRHRLPFADREALIRTFQDDAFYYFTIARNVAHGAGFTFDGVHATNGFQPLWLFTLVPVFRLFESDTSALRVVALLELLLISSAVVVFFRMLAPRVGRATALATALLIIAQPGAPWIFRSGMEGALVLLILVVTASCEARLMDAAEVSPLQFSALGALAGLAFLARVEAIVLVPLLAWQFRHRLRASWRAGLAFVSPPSAIAGAYVAWNRLQFGSWGPISGLVKQTLAAERPFKDRLLLLLDVPWFGQWIFARTFDSPNVFSLATTARVAYLVLIGAVLAFLWRQREAIRTAWATAGVTLLFFACLAMTALDVAVLGWVEVWQRGPLLVAVALLFLPLLWRRSWARVAAIGGALVFVAWPVAAVSPLPGTAASSRVQAAAWLREHLSDEDRIGSWNAGLIGYLSHRHVINFDGLVNDLSYFDEVIVGRRFRAYLASEHIRWIVDTPAGPDGSPRMYLERVGAVDMEAELVPKAVFAEATVWEVRSAAGVGQSK